MPSNNRFGIKKGRYPSHIISGSKAEWEELRAHHLRTFREVPLASDITPCKRHRYTAEMIIDGIEHCRSVPCPCKKDKCWVLIILLDNEVM